MNMDATDQLLLIPTQSKSANDAISRDDVVVKKLTTDMSPTTFSILLRKLVHTPDDFSLDDSRSAFGHLACPNGTHPSQAGAFLTALKLTGKESNPSIFAVCAEIMQKHAVPFYFDRNANDLVCDIVGTGGDGQNTFNVSTTAGIVAAGAGCRVIKHGNKAATSSSGSADILLSLGCPVTKLAPASAAAIAMSCRFLFLFAPSYHPAMLRVAPIRRDLAFPTVFNLLGPLINPARPEAMVVGVHSRTLGPIFAQALRLTGVKRAWVVCGAEGLDEISPAGPTQVWELMNGKISELEVTPATFGLKPNSIESVRGGTPSENAETLHALLEGRLSLEDPVENFVVMNTAALLRVAGKVSTLVEGVAIARQSIASGEASKALQSFRQESGRAVHIAESQ